MTRKGNETPSKNIGAWTEDEQHLFAQGCVLHGWGKWNLIKDMIPTRDRFQVKSHAQKFGRSHPEMKEALIKDHSLHIQGKTKKETQRRRLKVKVASATAVPPVMKNPTVSNQTKMDAVSNILPVALTQIEASLTTTSQAINSMFAFAQENWHKPPNRAPLDHVTTPRPFHNIPDGRSILLAPTNPHVITSNPDVKESNNTIRASRGRGICKRKNRWTEIEHNLFEQGYVKHGRGQWLAISRTISTKSRIQTKTHAQKFRRSHPFEIARLDRLREEYLKINPVPPEVDTKRSRKKNAAETREDYVARLDRL
ncbi:hypothetical protein ACHAXH_002265, partial [Discostella pseudostelligera]